MLWACDRPGLCSSALTSLLQDRAQTYNTACRLAAHPGRSAHCVTIMSDPVKVQAPIRALPNLIFASRWLQLPLYIGLIAAQAIYVFHFWVELVHLIEAAFGNDVALAKLISSIGYKSDVQLTGLNETIIMLVVLALIDVVMISNLLIMVI